MGVLPAGELQFAAAFTLDQGVFTVSPVWSPLHTEALAPGYATPPLHTGLVDTFTLLLAEHFAPLSIVTSTFTVPLPADTPVNVMEFVPVPLILKALLVLLQTAELIDPAPITLKVIVCEEPTESDIGLGASVAVHSGSGVASGSKVAFFRQAVLIFHDPDGLGLPVVRQPSLVQPPRYKLTAIWIGCGWLALPQATLLLKLKA